MKLTLQKILYVTIKNYELEERTHRNDFAFDAYEFLAAELGYKNSSLLRKMCEPRGSGSNAAKLGLDDAMKIMNITGDYRIFVFMRESLIERKHEKKQLDLFSKPHSEL